MNKNIIQNIKGIVLGLILVLGVAYVSAAWTPAPPNPPQNNVDAPINVGASKQEKIGDFTVRGILTSLHLLTSDLTVINPDNTPIVAGQVLMASSTDGKVKWGTISSSGGSSSESTNLHGKQKFTSSGTFTVPANVTKVWVTMSGGGGGGGYQNSRNLTCSNPSPNGTNSSFGTLLIAHGGYGGYACGRAGGPGGPGGTPGVTGDYGGDGGSSIFGNSNVHGAGAGYGYGGQGQGLFTAYGAGGGGGGAEAFIAEELSVIPLSSYTITVGVGAQYGIPGGPGFVLVEW